MNRDFARAFAAAVAIGLMNTAQAVPIYFDFTGRVFGTTTPPMDGAVFGDLVSGGFNFETDRLYRSDAPGEIKFSDWQPPADAAPLAFFNSPNRNVTLPVYGGINYNYAGFSYPCADPAICTPSAINRIFLYASSSEQLETGAPPDFTGALRSSNLLMILDLNAPGLPPDPLTADWSNLTFSWTYGAYSEQVFDCVLGACAQGDFRSMSFELLSYTAGVGPRTPVPEPATLGLLGIGLLGAFAARRGRQRSTH